MGQPVPEDEFQRLKNLYAYHILDTLPESAWDDVVQLAAYITQVPIAAISFVDADRQWFKAILGLDVAETPRSVSFCAHTILGSEVMVIADATQDERFVDNPLVTEEPYIRFYAGVPLVTQEGYALGALCVIDQAPKQLNEAQVKALQTLARQVGKLLQMHTQERELNQALRAARQSSRKQKGVLSNISHEMRTPLNAILGYAHLLQPAALNTEQRQYLQAIQSSSDLLLKMINNILDFAKIEAGKITLQHQVIQLDVMGHHLQEMLSLQARQKGLALRIDIDPGLPHHLYGDALKLQQVLLNLLNNAVKFTASGTVSLSLRQARPDQPAENDHVYCYFEVSDTGPGISQADQRRLFEPFNQLQIASDLDSQKGTGLGLTICKELVELMGGEIQLDSTPGQGSTFSFVLPLALKSSILPEQPERLGFRILLVDDHDENLTILGHYLREWDCEVEVAHSAELAERLFMNAVRVNEPFDILLVDWKMPGKSGLEMVQSLEKYYGSHEPVVLLMTSFSGQALQTSDVLGSIHGVLQKPLSPLALYHKLLELKTETQPALENLQFDGQSVLVVDDGETNRQLMKTLLNQQGLRVTCAENGFRALKLLMQPTRKYELVLMDFQMPKMGGIEATQKIRELPHLSTLPIIGLSADVLDEVQAAFKAAGGNDFLEKPIRLPALQQVLCKYLTPRKSQPESEKQNPEPLVLSDSLMFLHEQGVLDAPLALQRVLGQSDLLEQLLAQFCQGLATRKQKLAQLFQNGSLSEILQQLHALKGNSANLSLSALSEATMVLEQTLKKGASYSANLSERQHFDAVLDKTLTALAAAFQGGEAEADGASDNAMTRTAFLAELERLDQLLARYDVEAVAELSRLTQMPPELRKATEALKADVARFDYPAARRRIQTLQAASDEIEFPDRM